jgi:hypothetical protein
MSIWDNKVYKTHVIEMMQYRVTMVLEVLSVQAWTIPSLMDKPSASCIVYEEAGTNQHSRNQSKARMTISPGKQWRRGGDANTTPYDSDSTSHDCLTARSIGTVRYVLRHHLLRNK